MVREKQSARPRRKAPARGKPGSIWDTPRIKAMAAEPIGSPIDVTPEEARVLAKEAFGRGRGRWPTGVEYVKRVRYIWKGLLKPRNG
jgi:hypothetical protein